MLSLSKRAFAPRAHDARPHPRGGFTMIEALVVITLTALLITKVVLVVEQVSKTAESETGDMVIEDKARQVVDRIAFAIMGADRQTLIPRNAEMPLHASEIRYQISLGVQDGDVVWSDPEMIGLREDRHQVVWTQNPGAPTANNVVWTNLVESLLQGEVVNGIDDNGNGIVDEEGLSIVIEGNSVRIWLTLAQRDRKGRVSTTTVEKTVTCRNLTVES